ncbi:hypothetical protein [Paraburkholderia aspalathi]|uniref:hypothetical protein n=1 Tax=Paraburkholderia aspalathi TaxID=1324617 RepID=UPI001BAD8B65|nr:hypothetical protein [Paraburkholderia aspalathi]
MRWRRELHRLLLLTDQLRQCVARRGQCCLLALTVLLSLLELRHLHLQVLALRGLLLRGLLILQKIWKP